MARSTPSDVHYFWTLRLCLALCAASLYLMACATPASRQNQMRGHVDTAGLSSDAPPAPVELDAVPDETDAEADAGEAEEAHAAVPTAHAASKAAEPAHGNDADPLAELMVANSVFAGDQTYAARRAEIAKAQHPMAVVLTCSDSRVPPEVIFEKGLGELFIIRVAGNVVSPEVLGSIEYGVEHLHAPLVIVLGHSSCGAVKATVEGGEAPGSIGSLVERIVPAVEQARAGGAEEPDAVLKSAIDINVRRMVAQVKASPLVAEAVEAGHCRIVGARYDLDSGRVVVLPVKKSTPVKKATVRKSSHAGGH